LDDSPIRLSVNLLDDEDNLVFSGSSQISNPLASDVYHFRAIMKFVTEEVENTENETIQREVRESFSGKISANLTSGLTPSIKVSAKGTIAGVEVGGEVGDEGTTGEISGEIGGEDSETETNETGSSRVTKFTIRVPTGQLEIRPL
jgi:hypothetical protein